MRASARLFEAWIILYVIAKALQSRAFVQSTPKRPLWASTTETSQPLKDLKVAIVGGGPSGLLLAHKLLLAGAKVNLYEKRPRPSKLELEGRAYALGLGMRGRTAIKSVDEDLWKSVKEKGYPSERFHLHVGPLRLRLRDKDDGKQGKAPDVAAAVEASVLLFQADLCRALTDELERRWSKGNLLNMNFESKVTDIDLKRHRLTIENQTATDAFDLVVGCDGVHSRVRKAIEQTWPDFETQKEALPGYYRVVRLTKMPPKLDPSAVSLIVPKSGSSSAFVEPTAGGNNCILFGGRDSEDAILASQNTTELAELIVERFPLLRGADIQAAATQLAAQNKLLQAYSVVCNTYHYDGTAVLVGDAAHSTGGTSGQGVNSALIDSMVLADSLVKLYDPTKKKESLRSALLAYSQRQVPEGKALFDLALGPKSTTPLKKIKLTAKTIRDWFFKGRWGIGELPLRTMLTTSLKPFADIRRERDEFYQERFLSASEWNRTLAELDEKVRELVA